MSILSSKIKTFEELLVHEIADLMSAEEQLIEALPKMAEGATNKDLKKALQSHLKETENHLKRLEKIAKELEMKSSDKATCKAMKGLIAEGSEALKDVEAGPVLDAAIIGAAQRVEHYEMAAYGTTRAFAEALGHTNIYKLLSETLEEEKLADKKLSEVSDIVNPKALAAK